MPVLDVSCFDLELVLARWRRGYCRDLEVWLGSGWAFEQVDEVVVNGALDLVGLCLALRGLRANRTSGTSPRP